MFKTPAEILQTCISTAQKKAALTWPQTLVLAVLAGAFIAFAAQGSNMAAFTLLAHPDTYGLGKALAGALFPAGLIFVLVAGAELFTGNTLMVAALLQGKVSWGQMLRNWALVYGGNLLGSLLLVLLILLSGQLHAGDNLLGGVSIKMAWSKVNLDFWAALSLGLLCNWLVCLAVWMAYAATDLAGKIWAIFFPIWLFIASGFEHSVANMYYIPVGIWAKQQPAWAAASGLSAEQLQQLNWPGFWHNLLPVTLGNVLGGALFVAGAYWLAYRQAD